MFQPTLPVLPAVFAFVAGAGLGLAYFTLLARNLDLYLGGRPVAGAALHAGRLVMAAAGLIWAVRFGAIVLLACTLGILAGRHVVLYRARKEE